jgi:hypothetical protein
MSGHHTSAGDVLPAPARRLPGPGWWLLLAAAVVLLLKVHVIAAAAVLAFFLLQRARPFDFLVSYLLVIAGASIINYGAGRLTAELSLLTIALLFMLFCFTMTRAPRLVVIPDTPLTRPMIAYGVLTWVNFFRGLVVGNSPRFAGLELLAMLSLATVFLAATVRIERRTIATTMVALFVVGCIHLGLGAWAYQAVGMRAGGIFFTPVDGIIVSFAVPFVLREPVARWRWLYLFALTPMLLHQFLSFTRGYWLALIGTTIFSVVTYGGRGPGAGPRWRRAGGLLGTLAVFGVLGAAIASSALGLGNLAESAAERFASAGSTELREETTSNIVRLSEYLKVIEDLVHQPFVGYGLGYSFVVKDPITFKSEEHWFVHQNYLLVWLKQGAIGLALFVWVLIGAFRTGWRGRHLPDRNQAAWCLGAAAVALHLLIYCNVHFPLAEVNSTFLTALIWGGAMSLTANDWTWVRWSAGRPADGGESGGPEEAR